MENETPAVGRLVITYTEGYTDTFWHFFYEEMADDILDIMASDKIKSFSFKLY